MFRSWRNVAAYFVLLFAMAGVAYATQNNLWSPTTGTVSGLNLTQNFNNAIDSLNQMNSGASAPTNQLSGTPSAGNQWLNTTSSINAAEFYDGTSWIINYWIDTVNHIKIGFVGGGAINTVASASTTDLCSTNPAYLNVSGTTTINSFGSNCALGQWKVIKFTGILTLTYNASSMILPNAGANITTAVGDVAEAKYLGSGNWIVTGYQRATGAALSTQGLNIGASALGNSALSDMSQPVNIGITASVGSSALTVNITDSTGASPSASSPVLIPFRSATLATGTPTFDSLQSALSITVASGNTMGCTSNVACRLWIYIIDNAGTPVVGLMNCSSATQIFTCSDDLLYATASGTSGGSSAGTLYGSTGSLSGKAVRIVGYLEATETTAGTWATAPSKLHLHGPGSKKPGEIVQGPIFMSTASNTSCANGTQTETNINESITPTSAVNLIRATAQANLTTPAGLTVTGQFSRGTAPTLIGRSVVVSLGGSNAIQTAVPIIALDQPNTTSATTYAVYCIGSSGAGANPQGAMTLEEIMGALEPINDNGLARMVG